MNFTPKKDTPKSTKGGKKGTTSRAPPAKNRRPTASTHDWAKWRRIYAQADPPLTYEDLSRLPGAPHLSHIKKRAAEENWQTERQEYLNSVDTKIRSLQVDLDAQARMLQHNAAKALIVKGVQVLAAADISEATVRDAARLIQVGIVGQRMALGMDRDPARTQAITDQAIAMFGEFLQKRKNFTHDDKEQYLQEFAHFLEEIGS